MKIILFVSSIDKSAGGLTTYIQQLASELKGSISLTIVTGKSLNPVTIPGVFIKIFKKGIGRWFALKKDFVSILEDVKPDIVHINGIWEPQNHLFQKVSQNLGITVIVSPHGMLEPYILNRHPLKKKIALLLYQKKAIKKANYLHVTAQSELDQIRKLGFKNKAIVIPNGMDLSEVKISKTKDKNENFYLLFLSRIHPKKGIEILLKAIHLLQNEKVQLIIAGEGERSYIKSLQGLVKRLGLEKQVKFIGGVYGNEKWDLYQKTDLFVLPTYSENFGIVVIEALASELPVVTTTGTPWKELLTHKCGWWIDLNENNLRVAIKEAVNKTPEELKEMGARGKNLVESNYDIKIVSRNTLDFYQSVL